MINQIPQKKRLTKRINSRMHGLNPIAITIIRKQLKRNFDISRSQRNGEESNQNIRKLPRLGKIFLKLKNMGSLEALKLYFIDSYELVYPKKLKNCSSTFQCWSKFDKYACRVTKEDPNKIKRQKAILRKLIEQIPISSHEDMRMLIYYDCKQMQASQQRILLIIQRTTQIIRKLIQNEFEIPKASQKDSQNQEMVEVSSQMDEQMKQIYFYESDFRHSLAASNNIENPRILTGISTPPAIIQTFENLIRLEKMINSRKNQGNFFNQIQRQSKASEIKSEQENIFHIKKKEQQDKSECNQLNSISDWNQKLRWNKIFMNPSQNRLSPIILPTLMRDFGFQSDSEERNQ